MIWKAKCMMLLYRIYSGNIIEENEEKICWIYVYLEQVE